MLKNIFFIYKPKSNSSFLASENVDNYLKEYHLLVVMRKIKMEEQTMKCDKKFCREEAQIENKQTGNNLCWKHWEETLGGEQ